MNWIDTFQKQDPTCRVFTSWLKLVYIYPPICPTTFFLTTLNFQIQGRSSQTEQLTFKNTNTINQSKTYYQIRYQQDEAAITSMAIGLQSVLAVPLTPDHGKFMDLESNLLNPASDNFCSCQALDPLLGG